MLTLSMDQHWPILELTVSPRVQLGEKPLRCRNVHGYGTVTVIYVYVVQVTGNKSTEVIAFGYCTVTLEESLTVHKKAILIPYHSYTVYIPYTTYTTPVVMGGVELHVLLYMYYFTL